MSVRPALARLALVGGLFLALGLSGAAARDLTVSGQDMSRYGRKLLDF